MPASINLHLSTPAWRVSCVPQVNPCSSISALLETSTMQHQCSTHALILQQCKHVATAALISTALSSLSWCHAI